MSEKYYSEPSEEAALRSWALKQMLKGAAWAALLVFGLGMLLWAIWGLGQLLPDASKEAPSPYGALEMAQPLVAVV